MAKGVSIDLIVDPKKAIEGLDKASGHAGKATSRFASMGKIGGTAIAAVGAAAVGAATGLAAATVSAGQYADEILTAATNTNLSTETLQAYKYAAEQIDVSFETFTASQGKFTKSMQDAVRSGTSPAAEGFAALGLSVTDSSGNLVDSEQLYWQAIDALGQVTNETQRTALAQQIFGRSGAEMNSIIAQGSTGFAELTEQARANGAIMSGEQLAKLGAFDDKMQALSSTVTAAKNALGLTLLPVLDDLAGSGSSALGEFTSALLEVDGDISKAGPAFESLGTNVASALTTALPKILQVGSSLVSGLIQGIVSQGPTLIQTAIPLIVSFATGLLGMLPAILDAGIQILIALVQGVSAALPTLIPAAVTAIIGLVSALITNLPMLIEAGIQLVVALAIGLIEALPQLIEQIPVLILGIVTALTEAVPKIISAGVQLFLALIENLPAIIVGIVKAIPQIVTGIVGAFTNPKTINQIAKAGGDLIRGLWKGIQDLGDWLWSKISGFFDGIVGGIKDFFGINSPSTLFAGFGRFMVEGLEAGLAGPNDLTSISEDLSHQVTDGFPTSLNVSAKAVATSTAQVLRFEPDMSSVVDAMENLQRWVQEGFRIPVTFTDRAGRVVG